jgi:hypothetical protein
MVAFGQPSGEPPLIVKPDAYKTLVNPACSHCRDEAKRRGAELTDNDRVLCWLRGYSDGGAIPIRFFLNPYRVISDSYGVFVYDPDAGYARGFAPSYQFRFHGWRNGVMVMRHEDGTLYSCLTGIAFAGRRKGDRLKPIATLVSDWGPWTKEYPGAVAYHMFEKYKPVELPTHEDQDAVKSRTKPDGRLSADELVLGVKVGSAVRAYPLAVLEKKGIIKEDANGAPLVVLCNPQTRSAAAYTPVATQPRKYKAPQPNAEGISPPDDGTPIPPDTPVKPPRAVTLNTAAGSGCFTDAETHSLWDVAGRCTEGELKSWTLDWVDSVQVKWFAWAAAHPDTTIYSQEKQASGEAKRKMKEIAGTAEFLRLLPKPFATLKALSVDSRTVTLLADGEHSAKVWPVEADAEIKVGGWWGRLEQFKPGQRVWAWLKLDRQKNPVSVVMLADECSEFEMHGRFVKQASDKPKFTIGELEAARQAQKARLAKRWIEHGLPGTLTIHHLFSGELEISLDHEAMCWGRSLAAGDEVSLTTDPPIKGIVKTVMPWRERTIVRLVVGELQSSELKTGQRVGLKISPPSFAWETSAYPLDLGRPRSKAERVEWFLASIYCTCGIDKDVCTGQFYTLASCNPNGCGMPNAVRIRIGKLIEQGLSDRQILDELLKDSGPLLLQPHLLP